MDKDNKRIEEIKRIVEPERQEEEEKTRIKHLYAGYRDEINELLRKESYQELEIYFQSEKIHKICQIDGAALIMHIILNIYGMEVQEGVEKGILYEVHDMKSAVDRYLKVKFLMWRLEFLGEKEEMLSLMQRDMISVPFIKFLVHTSSFKQVETSFTLSMLLKEAGKWGKAFAMLNYVNELMPNQEIVFCEMADICIRLGQLDSARDCLNNIKNPSEILGRYQDRWRMLDGRG